MALSSHGHLLPVPEATFLFLQAPIKLQPGVKIPKMKHAFYRLSEGTWEYIDLCKALCGGNRKAATRQQEQWLKFERSRLVYHIPAAIGLLQSRREGWEVVKGTMRSMANSTANEYWARRQIQLNLNNSESNITHLIITSPPSSAEVIKSLETFTRLAYYTKIVELSNLYAGDGDAQLRHIHLSNTFLSMEHFDAFTLGIPQAQPSTRVTKKYQSKTARRNGFSMKAEEKLESELGHLIVGFGFSDPFDVSARDWKKDLLDGITLATEGEEVRSEAEGVFGSSGEWWGDVGLTDSCRNQEEGGG